MPDVITLPSGFNLVGTCGWCGGPLYQSMYSTGSGTEWVEPPIICAHCHKVAKKPVEPIYGPVMEMNDA